MPDVDVIDSFELTELRAAYVAGATADGPALPTIIRRGRAIRRRRAATAVTSAAAVATATTLVVASMTSGPVRSTDVTGHQSTPFTVRTAAYTIVSNANGTATLSITPDELFDPAALQHDLARAGVPALVTMGEFCTSDPAPTGFAQAVSYVVTNNNGPDQPDAGGSSTITIDPAALPAGAELSVGDVPIRVAGHAGVRLVSVTLVDKTAHSCSDVAATDSPTGAPKDQLRFVGIPRS